MKLNLIKLAIRVLRPIYASLEYWLGELEWAEIANSPVGPNPFTEGTLDYYLHEESNRIRAEHRITKKVKGGNPWVDILNDKNL